MKKLAIALTITAGLLAAAAVGYHAGAMGVYRFSAYDVCPGCGEHCLCGPAYYCGCCD